MFRVVLLFALAVTGTLIGRLGSALAQSSAATLRIEAKIPLGEVRGRIGGRYQSAAFVRCRTRQQHGRHCRHRSRQGAAGPERTEGAAGYTANGRIDLGEDADNVRVDQSSQHVVVGYGGGALVLIDGAKRTKISETRLPAHPEGFQLDAATGRAYVNVPGARGIAVADLSSSKVIAVWPVGGASANFPMAVDNDSNHVLSVFCNPPKLGAFDKRNGSIVRMVDACGDADDLFVDAKRHRVYVSCGASVIDIFDAQSYERLSRIPTVSGARTSLFVPELDRLFLAARASVGSPAAISGSFVLSHEVGKHGGKFGAATVT